MATPKKTTPIKNRKSRTDIEKAIHSAAQMETPGVSPEEGSADKTSKSPAVDGVKATEESHVIHQSIKKRVGRPPLKEGRTDRITVFLTADNRKRLRRAVLQEQLSREDQGHQFDQSLLVEEALIFWLEQNGY